jgi:hypothetical protein
MLRKFSNDYFRTPADRRRVWLEFLRMVGFILAWPLAVILGNLLIGN